MQAWNYQSPSQQTTNSSNKPRIAIAIPYNNAWKPEWVMRTRDPLVNIPLAWCDKFPFYSSAPSLPVARDSLVNEALKANCDYILFLDSDHVCEQPSDPNQALNILYQIINKSPENKDAKMITALYRAKQRVGFNYAAWMKAPNGQKGYTPIQSWSGNWIEIDAGGLGFCLIDIKIFKEISKPWFRWEISDEVSEDFFFFELAKRHGYNLHVFTDIKLSHLGNLKVKCDGTFSTQEM